MNQLILQQLYQSLLTQKNGIPTHKIAQPNSKLLPCRSVHKNLNIQALIDQNAQRRCAQNHQL